MHHLDVLVAVSCLSSFSDFLSVIVHALFPLRVFTVHSPLRVPLRVWSELIQGLGMGFI